MSSPKARWDTTKGRKLWDENKTFVEIAKACHVSRCAIIGYSNRHWPEREIDKARHAAAFKPAASPEKEPKPRHVKKAKPGALPKEPPKPVIIRGKTTLPPLPSLSFNDET